MEPRYQKYKDNSYQQYLVIQAGSNGPPTASLCKEIRENEQYGTPLTFPVLYDPATKLKNTYGIALNEENMVVGEGSVLLLKKKYANQSTVESTIEAALGL